MSYNKYIGNKTYVHNSNDIFHKSWSTFFKWLIARDNCPYICGLPAPTKKKPNTIYKKKLDLL